ncbi:hypothetical protein HY78_18895 [Rhizorhabdus wittichii DC-6]|nr:hypothetical protein HY78_18895 [Rhizorhabdus wittichii DC-6]
MPRRTATEMAEEVYQARHERAGRRYPDTVGPAGVPIPDPRTGYRVSTDPKLLARIIRAAFVAHRASILTPERDAALADTLAAALAEAFPPSDMIVLRRYGLASVKGRTSVELGRFGYEPVELPEPMALPNGKGAFHTGSGSGLPLPEAALSYFDDRAAIEAVKVPEFENAQHWPGRFKVKTGRWPFWREIEAAWPRVAAWMAKERAAAQPKGETR